MGNSDSGQIDRRLPRSRSTIIGNMSVTRTRFFSKRPNRHFWSVWALVTALFVTYGFGINRHIHVPGNEAANAEHAHDAEIHVGHGSSLINDTPGGHDDADWLLLDIDDLGITKKAPGADVAFALFGALFVLLYVLPPTTGRRLPLVAVPSPKCKSYYSVFPPTRAPPR